MLAQIATSRAQVDRATVAISPDLTDSCMLPFSVFALGGTKMNAYSYSCRDCEGMETCPASVVAATKDELWQLVEMHARVAHGEDPKGWDKDTRDYLGSLITIVSV